MLKYIFRTFILFTFFGSVSILPCDYCLITQGISPLETANGIGLRADQRYTRLSTLISDDGHEVDNGGAMETHWTSQFTGFYSVTPKFTVSAVVPLVRRSGQEGAEGGHHGEEEHPDSEHGLRKSVATLPGFSQSVFLTSGIQHGEEGSSGTASGLSDISMFGRYQLFQRHTFSSSFIGAVIGGVRVPTGKTDATNSDGEVLEAHLQPGTGAVNYLMGTSISYSKNRFSLVGNGIFSLATEGKVGHDTYQYGNTLNYDVSARFRLTSSQTAKLSLFAAAGISGEARGKETQNNETVAGTGGHTVYTIPAIQVFFHPLIFEASFWQPIAYNVNGPQLSETFKTYAGLTFMLK